MNEEDRIIIQDMFIGFCIGTGLVILCFIFVEIFSL